MDEHTFYIGLAWSWVALAGVIFVVLLRRPAPYGRFARAGWGWMLPGRLSWLLMELPAVLTVGAMFLLGRHRDAAAWAFLGLWNAHYLYRTFVYSALMRQESRMPVFVLGSGVFFNLVNGYLQGRWLFELGPGLGAEWLLGGRFWAGLGLFAGGLALHVWADATLRGLRRSGRGGYAIPRGGLFEYVSCPNYLGEMVQWGGWALLTWSPGGLAFAIWTWANLLPRALASHRWYRQTFPDYPPPRRAVLPGVL